MRRREKKGKGKAEGRMKRERGREEGKKGKRIKGKKER